MPPASVMAHYCSVRVYFISSHTRRKREKLLALLSAMEHLSPLLGLALPQRDLPHPVEIPLFAYAKVAHGDLVEDKSSQACLIEAPTALVVVRILLSSFSPLYSSLKKSRVSRRKPHILLMFSCSVSNNS